MAAPILLFAVIRWAARRRERRSTDDSEPKGLVPRPSGRRRSLTTDGIMPGSIVRVPATILLGIGGSFVGGVIGRLLFARPGGFLLAAGAAVVLLLMFQRGRRST